MAWGFLAESIVLALVGGMLALLMAAVGLRWFASHGPTALPRLHEIGVDGAVFAFAGSLSLVMGVVLGLLPMVRLPRDRFDALAANAGRGSTPGPGQQRIRHLLIVGQVAMALVLLVGCGLMLRSAARLYRVDPGVRIDGVVTAGVSLGAQSDRTQAVLFYHQLLDEVAALPGITSVGAANILPMEAGGGVGGTVMNGSSVGIKSRPKQNASFTVARYKAVTAGYFETFGMPLLEGRAPARADSEQNRLVVWVNETFAREFLEQRAIGEQLIIQGTTLEVVGIVGDVREFGLREAVRPTLYLPLNIAAVPIDVMHVVARTTNGPSRLSSALRSVVGRVNLSVPLATVRTMEEIVASSVAQTSLTMTLLSVAAGVALVLGVVGLYGVTRYIVSQRTSEIGVRLALGAQARDVRAMVLRQSLSVALVGVGIGLIAAYTTTRVMASLLFEVSARDPATFGGTTLILTAVSTVAAYLAANRATQIDPLVALRRE